MTEETLIATLVAVIAFTSVVIPFRMRPALGGFMRLEEIAAMLGPSKLKNAIVAVVLITIVTYGTYAAFVQNAPSRLFLGWFGPLLILTIVSFLVPTVVRDRFFIPILTMYLVVSGMALVVSAFIHFWIAAVELRALSPGRGISAIWINAHDNALGYWILVLLTALATSVFLGCLRNYFLGLVRRKSGSNRTLNADARQESPRAG